MIAAETKLAPHRQNNNDQQAAQMWDAGGDANGYGDY